MNCETCKFWDEYEPSLKYGEQPDSGVPDEGYGECKRFPPVLRRPLRDDEDAGETSKNVRAVMFWAQPYTTAIDWCGEWRSLHGEAA